MLPSSREIVVLGAGGHGKVVADVARSAGFTLRAFLDDSAERDGDAIWGVPVLAWDRFLGRRAEFGPLVAALGVGDNLAREACYERLARLGLDLPVLIHPKATVASTAKLGAGVLVMAGACINPDARVGTGCIVNTGAIVEHDCVLEPFVHLAPNAALGGGVRIGALSQLGLGAVALPGVAIGAGVRVGAGAVVHRPVADGTTVVGVPARPLSNRRSDT